MSPLSRAVTMNLASTVPPEPVDSTVPDTIAPVGPIPSDGSETTSTIGDVIESVVDNLGNNAYQTGVALIVATVAVVAMMNMKVNKLVLAPVTIGAFWFGWLGWNTATGDDNPLFPGDVSATKLWDVAFTDGAGFLIVVAVGCIAAIFLWRKGVGLYSRVLLLLGAALGASFIYNLVDSVEWN
jgi:hypothetical protein